MCSWRSWRRVSWLRAPRPGTYGRCRSSPAWEPQSPALRPLDSSRSTCYSPGIQYGHDQREWGSISCTHDLMLIHNFRFRGRPELSTLSKAYTEYSFVWPPPSQKGTLKMLIFNDPVWKCNASLSTFLKSVHRQLTPSPGVLCARLWKWWQFWTTL